MMRLDIRENGIVLALLGTLVFASFVVAELLIEQQPETPLRISVERSFGASEDEAEDALVTPTAGDDAGEGAADEELAREALKAELTQRADALLGSKRAKVSDLVSLGREARKLDEMTLAFSLFERGVEIDASSVDARYWRGRTHSTLGRNKEAIEDFSWVLSAAPNHQRATFYLGLLLHGEKRLAEAHKHLERASNISSGSLKARSLRQLALVLMDEKKPAEAIPLLVRSVNLRPDAAAFWFDLGQAHLLVGAYDQAASAMRKAAALDPQFGEAQLAYGLMLERRGDRKGALSALAKAVRIEEDDPLVHEARARVLLADGRIAAAAQEYGWLSRNASNEARLLHAQGQVEVLTGDPAEGVRLLLQSDDRDRGMRDASLARAALYLWDSGLQEPAKSIVARLKSRPPHDVVDGFEVADLAVRSGDWDWAARALRDALEAVPVRSDGWFLLGRVRSEIGDNEGAVKAYRNSITHNAEARNARLNLAVLLARLGSRDEALALYGELLDRHPRYATALYNRGLLNESAGRTAEAIADFESVVEVDPDNLRARERLATLLFESGRVAAALELLEDAITRSPGDPQLRILLAAAQLESGERDAARKSLRRAEALAGDQAALWKRIADLWSKAGDPDRAEKARARAGPADPAAKPAPQS